jgi:hypothetical protein
MKKKAWHSHKSDVYHNEKDCNTGNNIEKENLRSGTGSRRKCKECNKVRGGKR